MIVSVTDNTINLVVENTNLKKYQVSQILFYGYKFSNDSYHYNTYTISNDLVKIIDYLNSEKINFRLSKKAEILISEFHANNTILKESLITAQNIKRGKLDSSEFNTFSNFLATLPRKLKEHQLKAAFHLYSIKNGANFSVPGSGKTSVVLAVYEFLKRKNDCNIIYVIGPPSCFQPWKTEFYSTLGRVPETIILSGGNKRQRNLEYFSTKNTIAELYLSNFHTVQNDFNNLIKFFCQEGINVFLVVDEAHYIKQIGGTWATVLLEISKHAKYKCVLTGTPIPKSYTDLFNIFDFLWDDSKIISEEEKIKISLLEKKNKNVEVKQILDKSIGPFFYRVRKKDLGLKPAVFHEPYIVSMNQYENRIYNLLKAKIYELSKDEFFDNSEILRKLWKGRMMRLRQSLSYPKLLSKSVENYSEDLINSDSELLRIIQGYHNLEKPAKLELLTKKVLELNNQGQKVLIWSNFIGTLKLIKSHFSSLQLRSELIYGKTPKKGYSKKQLQDELTREEIRDIFINPTSGLDILIANPAACAESISLHKTCYHAFYYDLSYNCAQYLQSLDRIHRVGGSENNIANYYFLQYEDTIDIDIKENLEKKANKMYEIIEQDYEIYNLDLYDDSEEDDITAYKRLFHSN